MNKIATSLKPRLGFVGAGWIGQHRLKALAASEYCEIAAVFDQNPQLVSPLLQELPGLQQTESFEDLLQQETEGVVIATPSALHAQQAIAALDRGKAVFCQKPLGRNAEEARRVVEAAKANNRLLGLDLSYRHTKAAQTVQQLIESGELGELFHIELTFHNAYGPDKDWYYNKTLAGGGCVIDLGIHLVDLALWLSGFPQVNRLSSQLFAQGKPLSGEAIEDFANVQFSLNQQIAVQLACSWNLPAGQDAVIGATFYGSKGGVSLRNVNGSFYDFEVHALQGTSRKLLCSPPDDWGGKAAVAWAEQLAEKPDFDPAAYEFVKTAEVLDEIYRKAK